MEMASEWRQCADGSAKSNKRREELLKLVHDIVSHNMKHNAEVEACDLLIEIERLDLLLEYVHEDEHARVCLYLLRYEPLPSSSLPYLTAIYCSCVPLTPDPDNQTLIRTGKDIYLKFGKEFEALRCAIMLNDVELIRSVFLGCKDTLVQKQMAILLGRHQIFLELDNEKLAELNNNSQLHAHFHSLARELDIMAPKTPEDIYKTHLEQTRKHFLFRIM